MDLKELNSLMKMCRKFGVTDIDFGDPTTVVCRLKFGDMPRDNANDSDEIQTDELSPEQMAFLSVPGYFPGG